MYCPKCFNDTLKVASSGVVKLTFNGKSKSTSQFFYDLKQDTSKSLQDKLDNVVADYFKYYAGFQNKDPIELIEATSIDFICSNKCIISVNNKLNVIDLIFPKKFLSDALLKMGQKYNIPLKL